MTSEIKYEKITRHELDAKFFSSIRTAYKVKRGGKVLGYVWSKEGFSYRGTQGNNRGIRLEDFHPIDWYCGKELSNDGHHCYSRRLGAERLAR